jgi:hypothetical protein
MLQRIQSIYLIASLALLSATFFIPFGNLSDGITNLDMRSYGVKNAAGEYLASPGSYFIYLLITLILVVVAYALVAFKNRALQTRLLRLSFLLLAGGFVLIALYINDCNNYFSGMKLSPGISMFLMIGAIFFNMMALRSIRKDEALVRSVDRIR